MTKAVESGMPKLRIEEAAARRQARDRPRRGGDRRGQQVPGRGRRPRSSSSTSTTTRCARQQIARLNRVKKIRDPARMRGRARRADRGGAERQGQSARAVDRGEPGARDGRRDFRRAGSRLHPPPRRDPVGLRRLWRRNTDGDEGFHRIQREIDDFRPRGRPPAAHAGRQARPGRPRPRRQGDRHRLCRYRLRRRYRAAVPDARRRRRARRSRTTSTSSACRARRRRTRRWCRR